MQINRREFCQGSATVALMTAVVGATVLPPFVNKAFAEEAPAAVPEVELMKTDALPDMIMGSDKAPVTVIEYASMTCPHCAHFQEATFPDFKKRYIDSGKVKYILREFPLDSLAAAAFMLARCAGKDDPAKYFALVDTMFRQQRQWAVENPRGPLLAIAKQAGLTEAAFDTCLADQKILDGIESVRQRAVATFKVDSTPSFFVNGKIYKGALSIEELSKAVDSSLKS